MIGPIASALGAHSLTTELAPKRRPWRPGDPRPISAEERFTALARRAARKGKPLQWPPRQAARRAVRRSLVVTKSPRAARKVACDATGRPTWKDGKR